MQTTLLNKLKYYKASFQRKGIMETIKQVLFDYYYNKKFAPYNFQFSISDRQTSQQNLSASEEVTSKSAGKDGTADNPTSSYYLFKYFRLINIAPDKIHFLDLGCGSGKAMVVAMWLKFQHVTGVDLNSFSLNRAADNCNKAKEISNLSEFEIVSCDAAAYLIPTDVNVVFMCNPFYETTMKAVVNNILKSYEENKREMYIVYHSPLFANLFEGKKVFKTHYSKFLSSGIMEGVIYRLGK